MGSDLTAKAVLQSGWFGVQYNVGRPQGQETATVEELPTLHREPDDGVLGSRSLEEAQHAGGIINSELVDIEIYYWN